MSFTPFLIGQAAGDNVTQLTITLGAPQSVPAGSKIEIFVAVSQQPDDPIDTANNVYNQTAGSQSGTVFVALYQVDSALALARGNTIVVAPPIGTFSGRIAAFGISGLTSGQLIGSSAGQGSSQFPEAALANVALGDWCIGVVGVAGPSADGYTQSPGFSNPGNLNSQTTASFSAYAGYMQAAADGPVSFAPALGIARDWCALLVSLAQ